MFRHRFVNCDSLGEKAATVGAYGQTKEANNNKKLKIQEFASDVIRSERMSHPHAFFHHQIDPYNSFR